MGMFVLGRWGGVLQLSPMDGSGPSVQVVLRGREGGRQVGRQGTRSHPFPGRERAKVLTQKDIELSLVSSLSRACFGWVWAEHRGRLLCLRLV